MISGFIQKHRLIINTVIYAAIVLIIAGLLYMNRAGKEYKMFNHVEIIPVENNYETQRLTLPAGSYYMVVNYASPVDTPVTVCLDVGNKIEDTMEANAECGYYTLSFELSEATSQFCMIFTDGVSNGFEMYNYEMSGDKIFYNDDAFFAVLFIFMAVLVYLAWLWVQKKNMMAQKGFIYLAVIGLAIFASYPMFKNYIIYAHDLKFHLMRIEGVKDALLSGQFPVVIYPKSNNGYGTLGFLYPDFFLHIPALLRMCGVSMVTAYQTFLVLINLSTAIAAFLSVKSVAKSDYAALTATILYTLSPYRLNDLYIRGTLGESLAMIFLPVAIAGLYHILLGEKKKWYYLTIGYAGILQSHVLSCLFIAFISVITGVVLIRHLFCDKRYLSLLKAIGVFIGLNLWYLIPFLIFYSKPLGMSTIENLDFYEDAAFIGQLFMTKASAYVPLATGEGIGFEMQVSLGMAGGVALLLILGYLLHKEKVPSARTEQQEAVETPKTSEQQNMRTWVTILFTISVLTMFMATTAFPWKRLAEIQQVADIMKMVQFPFRLLSISTVALAFVCGTAVENVQCLNRYKKHLLVFLLGLSLLAGYELMDEYIRQDILLTDVSGGFSEIPLAEYWPEDTDREIFQNTDIWENEVHTSDYWKKGTDISFTYSQAGESAFVTVPLLYYPGYYAELSDGTRLKTDIGEKNRLRVYLPPREETQTVSIHYSYWKILSK